MTENMPELPSGQRWNVVKVFDHDYTPALVRYHVRLEKKRWWGGWIWVERFSITSLNKNLIISAARKIAADQRYRLENLEAEDKYLGAYPPKKLETNKPEGKEL